MALVCPSSSQHAEQMFQRHQCSFIHTLEVGRQLFSMGDEETQTRLQSDLGTLQEEWDGLHGLLGRRTELTEEVVKVTLFIRGFGIERLR